MRDGDAAKGTDTAASDESAAIKSASAAGSTDGLRRRAKAGTAVITVTSLEQLRASTNGSRNRVVEWGATVSPFALKNTLFLSLSLSPLYFMSL